MSFLGRLVGTPIELYQGMVDVYTTGGLNVQLLPKDSPEAFDGGPTIKVTGRNVELVTIRFKSGSMNKGRGLEIGPSISGGKELSKPKFDFHHIVRGLAGKSPDDLKAELKASTKGLIRKEVVDVTWEGGRLAAALAADTDLKRRLMEHQASEINVSADEKNNCIRIEYPAKVKDVVEKKGFIVKETTTRFEELPPMGVFEICDSIAAKAKSL